VDCGVEPRVKAAIGGTRVTKEGDRCNLREDHATVPSAKEHGRGNVSGRPMCLLRFRKGEGHRTMKSPAARPDPNRTLLRSFWERKEEKMGTCAEPGPL